MRLSDYLDRFAGGIFAELDNLKKSLHAQRLPVYDFSIGSPDQPPAQHIMQALSHAALDVSSYHYAIQDRYQLLDAFAGWYARRYGVDLNPETQIVSLMGSQEGLAHISMALLEPGDVVLAPDPGYPIFSMGPKICRMNVEPVPQNEYNGWAMDFAAVPHDVARRAKLIIASYPNNPVCKLAPEGFYDELVAFAEKYDLMVIHDNAYSELVYTRQPSGSFLSTPGAMDVGVEFNSLSKSYCMAGARIGCAVGNERIITKIKQLKSHMDFGIFLPVQMAAEAALNGPQDCVAKTREAYKKRTMAVIREFARAGWELDMPDGTMFIWARIPPGFDSSESFALKLARSAGVIVVPGSSFGKNGEGYVRLAMVQDEAAIAAAADSIIASRLI